MKRFSVQKRDPRELYWLVFGYIIPETGAKREKAIIAVYE
jgi:hypothetical protein